MKSVGCWYQALILIILVFFFRKLLNNVIKDDRKLFFCLLLVMKSCKHWQKKSRLHQAGQTLFHPIRHYFSFFHSLTIILVVAVVFSAVLVNTCSGKIPKCLKTNALDCEREVKYMISSVLTLSNASL